MNMKTKKRDLKIIAKFFNNYKIINFSNKKKFEAQRKIFTKQCESLGREVKDAIISAVKKNKGKTLDPFGAFIDDLLDNDTEGLVEPKVYYKVIDNLTEFKKKWNGNGIEIYPAPLLQSIVGFLTAENFNDFSDPIPRSRKEARETPKEIFRPQQKMKRSIDEAKEILKDMLRQAHADAKHSGSLSRLKSIVGLQRTSIGMLLDSLLEQFSEYASAKEYKKAQTIIKLDLKNGSQDLWDDYQAGGDYPPEFEKLTNYMMETLIG